MREELSAPHVPAILQHLAVIGALNRLRTHHLTRHAPPVLIPSERIAARRAGAKGFRRVRDPGPGASHRTTAATTIAQLNLRRTNATELDAGHQLCSPHIAESTRGHLHAIVRVANFRFCRFVDKGIACALGAARLFGASTPAAKLLLRHLSPLTLSAFLCLGAAVALSLYTLVRPSVSREAQVSRRDIPLIVGIIFFGGIAGPILMLVELQSVSALTGSLLLNLENPLTLIIAVALMQEHLGRREAFAATAITLGGTLITLEPSYLGGSPLGALEIRGCLSQLGNR